MCLAHMLFTTTWRFQAFKGISARHMRITWKDNAAPQHVGGGNRRLTLPLPLWLCHIAGSAAHFSFRNCYLAAQCVGVFVLPTRNVCAAVALRARAHLCAWHWYCGSNTCYLSERYGNQMYHKYQPILAYVEKPPSNICFCYDARFLSARNNA